MVHSRLIFSDFVLMFAPKLCVIFKVIKVPIYVMQENIHLCCRGSNKDQVWSFLSSHSRGGGGCRVFLRLFFGKIDAKGAFLANFLSNSW